MLGGPTIGTVILGARGAATVGGCTCTLGGGGGTICCGGRGRAIALLSYIMTMLRRRDPRVAIHFTTCITRKNTRNATDTVSTKYGSRPPRVATSCARCITPSAGNSSQCFRSYAIPWQARLHAPNVSVAAPTCSSLVPLCNCTGAATIFFRLDNSVRCAVVVSAPVVAGFAAGVVAMGEFVIPTVWNSPRAGSIMMPFNFGHSKKKRGVPNRTSQTATSQTTSQTAPF